MKFIKITFASLLLILCIEYPLYSQNKNKAVLEDFISRQAQKMKVKEYRYAREVLQGDVNGDGKEDLVVLYTLDGFKTRISYIRNLAVFLNDSEELQYADSRIVSGINERLIKLKSVDRGTINLETLEYMENGENHYRIVGKMLFILKGKKLKEI